AAIQLPCLSRLRSRLLRHARLLRRRADCRSRPQSRCENLRPVPAATFPGPSHKSCAPARQLYCHRAQLRGRSQAAVLSRSHTRAHPAADPITAARPLAQTPQSRGRFHLTTAARPGPDVAPNQPETDARHHRPCARVGAGQTLRDSTRGTAGLIGPVVQMWHGVTHPKAIFSSFVHSSYFFSLRNQLTLVPKSPPSQIRKPD